MSSSRPDCHRRAQLVEHQRAVSGLGVAEPPLERAQHLLHALRGALLLLDEVLETEGLVLQAPVGFLQLRTIAEQLEDAVILIGSERVPGGG